MTKLSQIMHYPAEYGFTPSNNRVAMLAAIPVVSMVRVVLASATLLRPDLVTRALQPSALSTRAAHAATRALGARELGLGVSTLAAWQWGSPLRGWVAAQCLADSADTAIFAVAALTGRIPRWRGLALAAFAASGAVTEALTLGAVTRRDRSE